MDKLETDNEGSNKQLPEYYTAAERCRAWIVWLTSCGIACLVTLLRHYRHIDSIFMNDIVMFAWTMAAGLSLAVLCSYDTKPQAQETSRGPHLKQYPEWLIARIESEDIASIGPLASTLWYSWENPASSFNDLCPEMTKALIRLLPRLTFADAWLLKSQQRLCLYRMLLVHGVTAERAKLLVSIIRAMEHVGDRKAVQYIHKLITREAYTAPEQKVREAAQECLPAVQRCAAQLDSNALLMRASAPPQTAPETLLRPALHDNEVAPEELLRSSNAEPQHLNAQT